MMNPIKNSSQKFVYPPVENFWNVDVPHEICYHFVHKLIGSVFIKSFVAFYRNPESLRGQNIDRINESFRKDFCFGSWFNWPASFGATFRLKTRQISSLILDSTWPKTLESDNEKNTRKITWHSLLISSVFWLLTHHQFDSPTLGDDRFDGV